LFDLSAWPYLQPLLELTDLSRPFAQPAGCRARYSATRNNSRTVAEPEGSTACSRRASPGDQASGVTFVASLLERVIEEQACDASRGRVGAPGDCRVIGTNLRDIRPGCRRRRPS
jgi:fumarylacetoacetate (FAA) hydrolase family protein